MPDNDHFRLNTISTALKTHWLGQRCIFLEEVGSTNDWLKQTLQAEVGSRLPQGTAVITDFQSQGRGRLNRRWDAPAGTSLLLSLLFYPKWPSEQSSWLTMAASLAVAEAIAAQTGVTARIKWPNDVVIAVRAEWHKVGWHKVSGILLDGEWDEHGRCQHIILGMGVNVNIPSDQLPQGVTPPTSLLAATGQNVSRLNLLADILLRLERLYEAADHGRSPQPDWHNLLITIGQPIQVTNTSSGKRIEGTAVATNQWGHLLVRDKAGRVHTILAGNVTLRRENFDNSGE